MRYIRGAAVAGLITGLALAVQTLGATAASAEPAVWEAQSGQGKVYLFGTVHLLKPDTVWDTPKVERAFAEAQELWLEVKDVDDPKALQPLVMQYGVDRAHPLSSKLDAEDKALLAKDAAMIGVPASAFEPFRPWLVSLQLSVAPMVKAGYDPKSGVEKSLKAKADARHETVNAFETAEQQLRFFADLPPEEELKDLHQTLAEFDTSVQDLNEAVADWTAGDVAGIDRVLDERLRKEAPKLYDLLIRRRNENMADQIAARLAKGGVIFVAVGAGHLAGPDSVQAALERRGVHVRRL